MKKLIKNPIFTFVFGAILFLSMGYVVASSIKSDEIVFEPTDKDWHVETAKEAIDNLKYIVNSTYTGSTEITPSTTSQTLATQNKYLNKNIKINAIPSDYHILGATTAANTDIINGITAYNSQGQLISGTGGSCVSGSVPITSSINTSAGIDFETSFSPSMFAVTYFNFGNGYTDIYVKSYNANNMYEYYWSGDAGVSHPVTKYYNITGKLNAHGFNTTPSANSVAYFIACK